jgi:hydrogenase maturation protease
MTLILCCGNRDRGDDAAGILVAERLAILGVPAETCASGAFELLDAWCDSADVIVVDAVVTGADTGAIHFWNADETEFPQQPSVSTHGFGPAQALALARMLGRLPRRLRIWGIEGREFELGALPSVHVRKAADLVAAQIAAEWFHDLPSLPVRAIENPFAT